MRNAMLLLCGVLIAGTSSFAQKTPAATTAGASPSSQSQALPTPPPLHPITEAQAREMLKLTGADQLRKQQVSQMMDYLQRIVPPYIPQDVMKDMRTGLENVDMDSMVVKIYKEHLSEKDAAAIIAFYKTSAGQDLLKSMPEIMKESQEAGIKAGQQVAQEVLQRHKAEIEAAAKKYQEMHSLSSQP